MNQDEMDRIYREMPLEKIPWNIEAPPGALVELIKNEGVKRCKTIDLGCGAGNYAIYLASVGFDVTGVDIAPTAIEIAKENAKRQGIKCTFVVADVLGYQGEVKDYRVQQSPTRLMRMATYHSSAKVTVVDVAFPHELLTQWRHGLPCC